MRQSGWIGRLGVLVLLLAVSAASVGVATAHAADSKQTSCWRRVIVDSTRGALGSGYPVSCYQTALSRLPDDVRGYSSAPDDIRRALVEAIRRSSPRSPQQHRNDASGTDVGRVGLEIVAVALLGGAVLGIRRLARRRP